MPRGPLPKPGARRRNPPTIPGTVLPAAGVTEPAPESPYEFGDAGSAWWAWAWATPQAAKWDDGALYGLARRAQLEDDMVSLESADTFCLEDFMDVSEEDQDVARRLETLIRRLKSLAGGRVSVMREMRELDNRFGLNAKAMADLRWSIGETEGEEQAEQAPPADVRPLRAV